MDEARVFLHTTINEHWGVAVAEAMAKGLPVAVHRSGGTWSDLVAEGSWGLGYDDVREAVEAVSKLMTNKRLWSIYSGKSVERVKNLTLARFIERFRGLLDTL